MKTTNVQSLSTLSIRNKSLVEKSTNCGCYHCGKIFSASDVVEWVDREDPPTALCPFCGIDSVLGDYSIELTPELLAEWKRYWFTAPTSAQDAMRFNIEFQVNGLRNEGYTVSVDENLLAGDVWKTAKVSVQSGDKASVKFFDSRGKEIKAS